MPEFSHLKIKDKVYQGNHFSIHKDGNSYIYTYPSHIKKKHQPYQLIAEFSPDHSRGRFFNQSADIFIRGGLNSLSSISSDQNFVARVLADRDGCCFHSAGVVLNGNGLLLMGHSGAGKTTIAKMLSQKGTILCDERIILRKYDRGFNIYGTWWGSDVTDASPNGAPLESIFFLNKASDNRLEPINRRAHIVKKLIPCLIKPFETADWWQQMLTLLEQIAYEVPFYDVYFDKSGTIVDVIANELSRAEALTKARDNLPA